MSEFSTKNAALVTKFFNSKIIILLLACKSSSWFVLTKFLHLFFPWSRISSFHFLHDTSPENFSRRTSKEQCAASAVRRLGCERCNFNIIFVLLRVMREKYSHEWRSLFGVIQIVANATTYGALRRENCGSVGFLSFLGGLQSSISPAVNKYICGAHIIIYCKRFWNSTLPLCLTWNCETPCVHGDGAEKIITHISDKCWWESASGVAALWIYHPDKTFKTAKDTFTALTIQTIIRKCIPRAIFILQINYSNSPIWPSINRCDYYYT